MNHLKLFYWPEVRTLGDSYPGAAFAIALSRERAIELICQELLFRQEAVRMELQRLTPEIHDGNVELARTF